MSATSDTNKYGQKLILEMEGKFRTTARMCEGGKYELGPGCTTWPPTAEYPKGRPVLKGETATPDQCLQLFAWHLDEKEGWVRDLLSPDVEVNEFQFSALVSLCYNIGKENLKTSTALRETNNKNWSAAAEAFGRFVFATSNGPSDIQLRSGRYRGITGTDPRTGDPCWISPTGEPCAYRQALLGLLIRHHREGLLYLGLPWDEACNQDNTFLDSERHWIADRGRYEDTVNDFTPFETVLRRAEALNIKLAPTVAAERPAVPALPPPVPAAKPAPAPVPAKAGGQKPVATAKPQAPVPAAKETVDIVGADIGRIRVDNGAKVMETSDRAVAVGLKLTGIGIKKVCEHRILPAWIGATYFEVVSDPVIVGTITIGIVALWMWGHAILVTGRRKRIKHAATATTVAY